MTLSDFLAKLSGVRQIGTGGFVARCPCHDDKHASLTVSRGDKGILANCKAGCPVERVVYAMGLTMRDLFDQPTGQAWEPRREPKPNEPPKPEPKVIRETPYRLQVGTDIVEHIRLDMSDGSKRYSWRKNGKSGLDGLKVVDVPLYHVHVSSDAANVPAYVVEGEKCAHALDELGFDAYATVCGASACPSRAVLEVLKSRDVVLWPDNDDVGRTHMAKIGAALKGIARSCVVISWGENAGDDVADLVSRGGGRVEVERLTREGKRVFGMPLPKVLADGIKPALEELDRYSRGDWKNRVQTGIAKLDGWMMGGLRPGRVTLVGAMTGAGKTTLAQIIACHCARTKGPALFVSPEMTLEELAEREIIREAGRAMQERKPSAPDKEAAIDDHSRASGRIWQERLPVYVLDEAATMDDVEAAAEVIEGLRLIVIDYAQEVADDDPRKARYLAVGDVARRSVRLAQKLNVPVLIASQLNEIKGKDGSVMGHEFRETRVLEQKASVVWILTVKREDLPGGESVVTEAKLLCRKHRGGPTFSLDLYYHPKVFLIADKESGEESVCQPRLEDVNE